MFANKQTKKKQRKTTTSEALQLKNKQRELRCDYFIVTHCIINYSVVDELSTLKNSVFRRSKITRDGHTDGRTDTTSYRDA